MPPKFTATVSDGARVVDHLRSQLEALDETIASIDENIAQAEAILIANRATRISLRGARKIVADEIASRSEVDRIAGSILTGLR